MNALLTFSTAIDRLNAWIGTRVSWLILASILVSAVNAVVRKTLDVSSNAWLELQWYLFGAAFLLAAPYTLKQNEHIRIDILYGMWPRRVQRWIDLIGHILFLMPFTLLLTWLLIPYVVGSIRSGEVSSNAGGLILWPAKAMLLAGFALLALQGASEIIKKVAVIAGVIPDPVPPPVAHAEPLLQDEAIEGTLEE